MKAATVLVASVVAGGMSYMTVEAGVGPPANVVRPEPGRVAAAASPAGVRSGPTAPAPALPVTVPEQPSLPTIPAVTLPALPAPPPVPTVTAPQPWP